MSSSPTAKQWLVILLVNVVVSGMTAFFVFRALTSQLNPGSTPPAPAAASAGDVSAVGSTSTPTLPPSPSETAPATSEQPGTSETPNAGQAPADNTLSGGGTTATAAAAPTATPGAPQEVADIPATPTLPPANVRISAVLFPGQLSREVAVLVNEGEQVNLKGWTLSSGSGATYTFPDVILFQDNFINLHTTSGTDVPTDLFWNRTEPAWKSGDTLTLARGDETVTTFTVR